MRASSKRLVIGCVVAAVALFFVLRGTDRDHLLASLRMVHAGWVEAAEGRQLSNSV